MFTTLLIVTVLSLHAPHKPIDDAAVIVERAGATAQELASSQIGNLALYLKPHNYLVKAELSGLCASRDVKLTRHERVRRVTLYCNE